MSFQNDDFDSETYVKVNTRLQEFWAKYPEGRLETTYNLIDGALVMKAELYRNQQETSPASTGHAFLSSLDGEKVGEYTETVAVGRALALLGFRIEKSIASGEEMSRFKDRQNSRKGTEAPRESKIKPVTQAAPAPKTEPQSVPQAQLTAEALKQEAAPVSDAPQVPKTLRTSRIFKPPVREKTQ